MRLGRASAALVCAAWIAVCVPAFAGAPAVTGDTEKAREWAEKASQRFDAGDYRGAVQAMEEAEKHFRAPTFLQLRAQALEKLGRLVEARDVYRTIAEWQLPDGAAPVWVQAKNEAPQQVAALDARIPKLLVTVDGAPEPDVAVDGAKVSASGLGVPIAKDPGAHTVTASAEGTAGVMQAVTLKEGATERVRIVLSPGARSGLGLGPALGAFGVGAAGLVLGGVFGGLAASKKDDVVTGIDACGGACAPAEKARLDGALGDAKTFANVSTAGFVIGGVGAAAGVTLLVLSRSKGEGAPSIQMTVGGLRLSGRF